MVSRGQSLGSQPKIREPRDMVKFGSYRVIEIQNIDFKGQRVLGQSLLKLVKV